VAASIVCVGDVWMSKMLKKKYLNTICLILFLTVKHKINLSLRIFIFDRIIHVKSNLNFLNRVLNSNLVDGKM
jgi:hypothetical protein